MKRLMLLTTMVALVTAACASSLAAEATTTFTFAPITTAANRQLAEGVERYDNAVLVDWFTPMDGRSDMFAADNFHPTQAGRVIYADLVAEAIFPNREPATTDSVPCEPRARRRA